MKPGLMVLVGVAPDDDRSRADRLLERLLGYRVFADAAGKMNLDLRDAGGGLLLVNLPSRPIRAAAGARVFPLPRRRLWDANYSSTWSCRRTRVMATWPAAGSAPK